MTIPLLVQAKRARARLRQLASNLGTIAVSKSESVPVRETARELAHGLRVAADMLAKAEEDAIAARDRAYAAREKPRVASLASPWHRERHVTPKGSRGVQ